MIKLNTYSLINSKVTKHLLSGKLSKFSFRFILLITFLALFSDFLANEKPIAAKYKGKLLLPVTNSFLINLGVNSLEPQFHNVDWKNLDYDWAIFPPIPYSPSNIDYYNAQSASPFKQQTIPSLRWRHWLGTDALGRDVLSGIIHGTRIAISVGLLSVLIALFIGVSLGSIAGYFGDNKIKISLFSALSNLVLIPIGLFWAFDSRRYILSNSWYSSIPNFLFQLLISFSIVSLIILFSNRISLKLRLRKSVLSKNIFIHCDLIISRIIEIINSIPVLFLVLSLLVLFKPSLNLVILIIGFTTWTSIAKLTRAEILKIKNLEYMEAAKALGYSNYRSIMKHALPNALSPVFVAAAFGVASAIITESTLSFIGIGLPPEVVTWGSLLSEAKNSPSAWWLAVFPGFLIFLTVTSFNIAGENLSEFLDPKRRTK